MFNKAPENNWEREDKLIVTMELFLSIMIVDSEKVYGVQVIKKKKYGSLKKCVKIRKKKRYTKYIKKEGSIKI